MFISPHTHSMRLRALFVCVVLVVGARPAAAAPPAEETSSGTNCVTRVATPTVENILEAHWSPDSTRLALVWFATLPSPRSPTGYREQEIVDTLDLRTGQLWP